MSLSRCGTGDYKDPVPWARANEVHRNLAQAVTPTALINSSDREQAVRRQTRHVLGRRHRTENFRHLHSYTVYGR
jgi:hypothetical protein